MSDVLVKGMDMPTACRNGKCNFACSAAYQTGLICIVRKQYVVPGDVPVDCPCSFVPPHGRLGDLDAVEAEIREKTNHQFCVNIVHAAPTIIEADCLPVLHGTFGSSSEEEAKRRLTVESET